MKTGITIVVALLSVASVPAWAAGKSCEALKSEIAAKLDAKGVQGYELTIVTPEELKPGQSVVGSCESGSSKIVYERHAAKRSTAGAGQ